MKHYTRLKVLLFIIFISAVTAPFVFADAKSDYDYQYGKYRQNYSEFQILKQDYLATPSLDNQQKALLSAKQSILARDLAKASLHLYISDRINSYKNNYELVKPILVALAESRQYFLAEAKKSQAIVTQEDIKKFTQSYLSIVPKHDSVLKFGLVANKISALVRIQTDSKTALDTLIPKLPTPLPTSLSARILELQDSAKVIDRKIDLLANNLNLAEAVEETTTDIFYTAKIEKLIEIRDLQLAWIERLIDIDKNYVQPKI